MTEVKFVMDTTNERVHLLVVEEDNPSVDVTVCGESPGGMEGEWEDLVLDRAGFYPVPITNVCMKCFPNLRQYAKELPEVALNF